MGSVKTVCLRDADILKGIHKNTKLESKQMQKSSKRNSFLGLIISLPLPTRPIIVVKCLGSRQRLHPIIVLIVFILSLDFLPVVVIFGDFRLS